MLSKTDWSINRIYRTGTENEPLEFYLNALANSNQLEMLLGYFSSSAISLLSLGFAKFLYNNGSIKFVINNILSENDKIAIQNGLLTNEENEEFDITNIQEIKSVLDEYGIHFFECLAWLISQKKIQFQIVKPKDKLGISHYKSGVFSDGTNKIGFKGSCNFTASGLLENLEELDIFLSNEDIRSKKWIENQNAYFDCIFLGNADFVEYLNVNQIQVAIYNEFGDKNINELLTHEKELIAKKKRIIQNPKIISLMENIQIDIDTILREPSFPYPSGAREYQKQAYQNWVSNDYKGIFAMATGTGKTITSLNCVLEESKKTDKKLYHAIILVPTITLVEQWEKEAKSFNYNNIIKVSSKFDWKKELATTLSISKRIPTSFIVISTYASFVKDSFQLLLKNFPPDTIFVADEGHNLASSSVLNSLQQFSLSKRIGLSATPKRIYDEEGSLAMERFFNDKEPYTYSYSMEKAIDNEVLCKYYYFPHIVTLTSDEFADYYEITKRLTKYLTYNSQGSELSEVAQTLLLKRKRIIHKASNKLSKTIEILKSEFQKRKTLKYTFVYVPEGISNEITETCEEFDKENVKLINQFTREIAKIDDSITVNQFISGKPDRDEILSQFKSGKIQVIASMKCLDEGVDIPRAEYAVFCSSTGNPRQFIQRRGRILRRHPDKHLATIYDLVVVPDFENIEKDSETFIIEKRLITKELERVMYFASLSINPYYTEDVFKQVCDYYDLNLYTIQNELRTV